MSSREKKKRNKRKAVLKLAERELLLKWPIQIPNKESAELDLEQNKKALKKITRISIAIGR
jgi:hypothetical protein